MLSVGLMVVVAFGVLASIHFYWALGGRALKQAAVPEIDGRAAFIPSSVATFAVALALVLCAWIVGATAGLLPRPMPATWLFWVSLALAALLLVRAIGDFRFVGFFKRIRGTRFARLDSLLYAPLCLVLSVAVAHVAVMHRA